jgi:hypothetical protein
MTAMLREMRDKMRKLLLSAAGIAALMIASPASAANTALILWNAADPAGFESAVGVGQAALATSDLDGITITLSNVTRQTDPNRLSEGNINIDNTTGSVQTLNLIAGANGFLGPSALFALTGTIGVVSGGADLSGSFFADGTNTLNGTNETVVGVNLNSFDSGSLTGPFSFSRNLTGLDFVNSPYGMAEELSLTLQPGAEIFVQGASMQSAAIPEAKTWAMLMVGFGLMAAVGWRRSRSARFAL